MCFQLSSLVFRNQYAHQVFRSQAEDNRPVFFQKAKGFGDYPLAIYLVLCGKVRFLARNMSTYRFLSEGSWTSRHNTTDVSKKIDHYHSVLSMLEEVDRFTKGEYHSTINRTKLNYEYDLYRLTHKGILPKPKFIPVYMMRQMHRVANKVGITWK